MPQTEADQPSPLDYAVPVKSTSDWAAWSLAITFGAIAGYCLSDAGFGVGGIAILAGIVIGTLSAFAAERRQFLPGLAGDAVATAVGVILASIKYPRVSTLHPFSDLIIESLALYMFLAVPTVFCAGTLWLARQLAHRAAA